MSVGIAQSATPQSNTVAQIKPPLSRKFDIKSQGQADTTPLQTRINALSAKIKADLDGRGQQSKARIDQAVAALLGDPKADRNSETFKSVKAALLKAIKELETPKSTTATNGDVETTTEGTVLPTGVMAAYAPKADTIVVSEKFLTKGAKNTVDSALTEEVFEKVVKNVETAIGQTFKTDAANRLGIAYEKADAKAAIKGETAGAVSGQILLNGEKVEAEFRDQVPNLPNLEREVGKEVVNALKNSKFSDRYKGKHGDEIRFGVRRGDVQNRNDGGKSFDLNFNEKKQTFGVSREGTGGDVRIPYSGLKALMRYISKDAPDFAGSVVRGIDQFIRTRKSKDQTYAELFKFLEPDVVKPDLAAKVLTDIKTIMPQLGGDFNTKKFLWGPAVGLWNSGNSGRGNRVGTYIEATPIREGNEWFYESNEFPKGFRITQDEMRFLATQIGVTYRSDVAGTIATLKKIAGERDHNGSLDAVKERLKYHGYSDDQVDAIATWLRRFSPDLADKFNVPGDGPEREQTPRTSNDPKASNTEKSSETSGTSPAEVPSTIEIPSKVQRAPAVFSSLPADAAKIAFNAKEKFLKPGSKGAEVFGKFVTGAIEVGGRKLLQNAGVSLGNSTADDKMRELDWGSASGKGYRPFMIFQAGKATKIPLMEEFSDKFGIKGVLQVNLGAFRKEEIDGKNRSVMTAAVLGHTDTTVTFNTKTLSDRITNPLAKKFLELLDPKLTIMGMKNSGFQFDMSKGDSGFYLPMGGHDHFRWVDEHIARVHVSAKGIHKAIGNATAEALNFAEQRLAQSQNRNAVRPPIFSGSMSWATLLKTVSDYLGTNNQAGLRGDEIMPATQGRPQGGNAVQGGSLPSVNAGSLVQAVLTGLGQIGTVALRGVNKLFQSSQHTFGVEVGYTNRWNGTLDDTGKWLGSVVGGYAGAAVTGLGVAGLASWMTQVNNGADRLTPRQRANIAAGAGIGAFLGAGTLSAALYARSNGETPWVNLASGPQDFNVPLELRGQNLTFTYYPRFNNQLNPVWA